MQKIQDSVFSIVKTTNLSPAVFSFLQPSDEFEDKTPLGGIFRDTKYGWLALGPKFCVVDLRTGLKVAARTFGASLSNNTTVTCVVELPKPLTENSQQLVISLQCDDIGMICVLHVNGSQILRCMQTDTIVTELAVCERVPDGPFTCFDGLVMAGTKRGEIFAFDLNRASLIKALKDISQGYEHLVQNESNPTNLSFLPLNAIQRIEEQRELAVENDHHLAILLNENSMVDGQYIFRNPDGTVRMKAKRDHIRVTVLQYVPQLGSMAVGFNFGAFQIWNLMTLDLEFTSQVNVECLPVTHFAFQEPCDDPRAFCYLWVVFSVIDRYDEEEFPLAVMYSLTYQGKRMLSDTKCLYQDFSSAAIRFQVELSTMEQSPLIGGKCISCHSYSIQSTLGDEGEDSMLNICQLVWECWGEDANAPMQYGMLLFDLDQWYKDQMPATYSLESNAFMSAMWCTELTARGSVTLHARLDPASVFPYSHATRLEEHFYPNSLQYNCICLNTCEALTLRSVGVQRQVVAALEAAGGAALLHPARLHAAAARAGLAPHHAAAALTQEDQRRYLLSVALEARLSRFLKRCAHDWATGSHAGVGCTLPFLVDWAWKRALELKENAKELTAPLFMSTALPDGNVIRCLEHCVQQLIQLTGLMDAVLTKCCNLVVPDALSEMEEVHVGIGCVSLYFQVVQWFVRVGLLPERPGAGPLPYPRHLLSDTYNKRRLKLNRLQDSSNPDDNGANKSCSLLYIDQLIEHEFGGDKIHQLWIKGGSECHGLYPPPSLYSLLRLYLLPEIAEEHKHSLMLYMLVDYSMIYDDVRYEEVIRRLMQFPTMFGLSNTAIKATQAFWHLDHRDFDFALDQLQCLTGNTLHEWQHNVVLSSLLAQKKTQAALQYLHVRKPAPVQNKDGEFVQNYSLRMSPQERVSEWQSCVSLYLARGLVPAALEAARGAARRAGDLAARAAVLHYLFKGCRNSGNLAKLLQVTLLPFEEEVFVKYLENCNEAQTSDLLIMFFLQQARYLEAERYNNRLKKSKPHRNKELSNSAESLLDVCDRDGARDALVEVVCAALPSIAGTVARCAREWSEIEPHVDAPKPMSVFIQANSPKNTFTYKSSFIQDTIENASETWMNRPKMKKGMKRALDVEETPFICTPKLIRTRSVFTDELQSESTPPKRARLSVPAGTPHTPKQNTSFRVSEKLSKQMEELLDMPDAQSPMHIYRDRAETPHSILKLRPRSASLVRSGAPSPAGSRLDNDDELETASSHTHYSDTTNKHLRFTIPTASESGSTPSPVGKPATEYSQTDGRERDGDTAATAREREMDLSTDSYLTSASHATNENNLLESPLKKTSTESTIQPRRSYKDTVRARLSLSANSSLSEDPNTSIESIADIPVTLINPRYSGERKRTTPSPLLSQEDKPTNLSEQNLSTYEQNLSTQYLDQSNNSQEGQGLGRPFQDAGNELKSTLSSHQIRNLEQPNFSVQDVQYKQRLASFNREREADRLRLDGEKREGDRLEVPITPRARRGIRSVGESTPVISRSRSGTPERQDSPIATPLRSSRITRSRSRSRTPETSPRSSPLASIPEQPRQETESEPHPANTRTLAAHTQLRSRSRTPERMDWGVSESPKLEVIKESPTKSSDSPSTSPSRRSLRSRSRTPEIEIIAPKPSVPISPRNLRSRSKTPEKLMSPKKEHSVRTKKSLSRLVLEQNTFAKTKQTLETLETEITESRAENAIECTPMKTLKQVPSLMDVTLSPIDKSPAEAKQDAKIDFDNSEVGIKTLPAFTTLHETYFEKSVLKSYQSSIGDVSQSIQENLETDRVVDASKVFKPLAFTTINVTDFNQSVLHSYESSVADPSHTEDVEKEKGENLPKPLAAFASMIENDFEKSVLHSHQSSMATPDASNAHNANTSSLITNDSDEDETVTYRQEVAARKERERIAQIEREIIEIREGALDDSEDDSDGFPESVAEQSVSEVESEESDSSEESSSPETDEEDDENEVISIVDSESSKSETNLNNTASNTNDADIDEKKVEENLAVSEKVEGSLNDPLNQGLVSLLTDDNSNDNTDQSLVLNYSDDKDEPISEENLDKQPEEQDAPIEAQIKIVEEIPAKDEANVEQPVASPEGMDVVDTSVSKTEIAVIQPEVTKPKDNKAEKGEKEPEVEKMEVAIEESKIQAVEPEKPTESDKTVVVKSDDETKVIEEPKPIQVENSAQIKVDDKPTEPIQPTETEKKDQTKDDAESVGETPAKRTRKRVRSTSSIKSTITEPEIPASKDKETESKKTDTLPIIQESEPKTPRTRKRANSNASVKSRTSETPKETTDEKVQETEELKTPATRRKRSQSNVSKDNVEENTPESTPTRRAKTPTSTEIRRIVTRRVSKEMREKLLDKSNESIESVSLTPKRRSARANSKNDDNDSVASESSVVSNISRVSEDAEVKPTRKGRKSVLVTKPDLSVIPEVIAEESKEENVVAGYSGGKKAQLAPPDAPSPRGRRRASTVSRGSLYSDLDEEPLEGFDVEPIDRISLLNKTDFEGSPDTEELQNMSPESVASGVGKATRSRLVRAASESRTAPRAAKIGRRIASMDVAESSGGASPGSPARAARRASFTRAIEALHTPKGRRTSTDVLSPVSSPAGAGAEAGAAAPRRPRRASALSATSHHKSDGGKRSKKMPVLEEDKETKK